MNSREPTSEQRLVFTRDLKADLHGALKYLESRRVLLLVEPSRRFIEDVVRLLAPVEYRLFDQARVHVPSDVVTQASEAIRSFKPDTLVSLGGGSVTGLGKALRLEHDVGFIALPTTYAGSERTPIYGITTGREKKTSRDPRVKPDVVIYEPSFTLGLPKKLSIQSLLNALSHPISTLAAGSLLHDGEEEARAAVQRTVFALEELVKAPGSLNARMAALRAASDCGAILDKGTPGTHHRIAHFLGGSFDLNHAGLHSVLLPHTVRNLAETNHELLSELHEVTASVDLPAALFDLLARAGGETSLSELGVEREPLEAALRKQTDLPHALIRRTFQGRRPSVGVRLEDWGFADAVALSGPKPADARMTVIALHGRGANAEAFLRRISEMTGDAPDLTVVAPQSAKGAWYSKGYASSLDEHGDELTEALSMVDKVVTRICEETPSKRVVLAGFSQGACLAAEYLARANDSFAGLIAFFGARIGKRGEQSKATRSLDGTQVFLGVCESDEWVSMTDVEATGAFFRKSGAEVTVLNAAGNAHQITGVQRVFVREFLLGRSFRKGHAGFGNAHETEALEGALPLDQNSPRISAYGLYAEQINATGFVAQRGENKRSWLYRIRPAAQHSLLEPLEHPTFRADFNRTQPEPNLVGWAPVPIPEKSMDFVDGIATLGGAGSPDVRRGFALHLYAANRSMEDRGFYNADGELLLVPELGRITLLTELGVLDVDPGMVAILPRGLKFSVLLRDSAVRGYIGEVFGRCFHLPERGPVGANGLTDARHFRAPTAYHENRLVPGYRMTSKYCGELFEARQDYSPYDVVAWHGNYTPYVYELRHFSPVVNGRFDHADPSIFSVLSAPLDEEGAHSLDFVFFPPRWDVSEGTFRPPFFHRNAVTEINGIIRDPNGEQPPFYSGGCFVTPSMTAHGVRASSVEGFLAMDRESADKPHRFHDSSMWFQFETALPIYLTPWARHAEHRISDWHHIWGAYRDHYQPVPPIY